MRRTNPIAVQASRRNSRRTPRFVLLLAFLLLTAYAFWPPKQEGLSKGTPLQSAPVNTAGTQLAGASKPTANQVPSVEGIAPRPIPSSVAPKPQFALHVRVWTREGEAAVGASIVCRSAPSGKDVEANGEAVAVDQADGNGEATCSIPSPGRYRVYGTLDNLAASSIFRLNASQPVQWTDLVLGEQRTLKGVTVEGNGKPIDGVAVTCLSRKGGFLDSTISDVSGRFEFRGLAAGAYYVRGELAGYAPSILGPVEPDGALRMVLSLGSQLKVQVREEKTGSPVSGIHLAIDRRTPGSEVISATTDGLGEARLSELAPGSYDLQSHDSNYTLIPPLQQFVLAGAKLTQIDVVAGAAGSLAGRVVDGDTGAAVAGVDVSAGLQEKSDFDIEVVTTDTSGMFRFSGLPAGIYGLHISARPEQYGDDRSPEPVGQYIEIAAGESRDDVMFTLRAGATLNGRVIHSDGTPAPGATILARVPSLSAPEASAWSGHTVSDNGGYFTLRQVPEDRSVFAQARLHAERSEEVGPLAASYDGGLAVTLEIVDTQTGNLAGRVVDESGSSVLARLRVVSNEAQLTYESVKTDHEGYFFYPDLPAGDLMFQLANAESGFITYTDSAGPVRIAAGQTTRDVTFVIHSSGLSISGTILDVDGVPVRNYFLDADILGEEGSEFYASAMADENGRFAFENVQEGSYILYNSPGNAVQWTLRVNAGDDVEVRLPARDQFQEAESVQD